MNRNPKIGAIIAIIISIIFASGCLDNNQYGNFEMSFERYYSTNDEKKAIEIVENLNYTVILGILRFDGFWANFIDYKTINFYNDTFFQNKNDNREANVYYEYFAWGKHYENLNIKIKNDGWKLDLKINGDNPITGAERYLPNNMNYYESIISIYQNDSWEITKEINRFGEDDNYQYSTQIINGYYVEMYLGYDDIWGPRAAVFVHTQQIIILNEDFQPLMVICSPSVHEMS